MGILSEHLYCGRLDRVSYCCKTHNNLWEHIYYESGRYDYAVLIDLVGNFPFVFVNAFPEPRAITFLSRSEALRT